MPPDDAPTDDPRPLAPLELPEWPERAPDSHKGTYGSILIVAGSRRYPGAAILAALGAGRAGAGLVRLALPAGIVPAVVPAVPFATVRPCAETADGGLAHGALADILDEASTCTAAVLGPGLGQDDGTGHLLADLLPALALPLVLDADGLNLLARIGIDRLASRPAPTVLTPHPGEFVRLAGGNAGACPDLGPPQGDARVAAAAAFARRTGAVVVLKGHATVVTDGRRARVERSGNPGMATGGMGDVLSGALGALLARLADPAQAAALAVHAHALAGDAGAAVAGQEALLPEDVALGLGAALAACRRSG